jgi:trigger factor
MLGRLETFVSKPAMNIDGFSSASIELFWDKGWLRSFADIYEMRFIDRLAYLEGWGTKSINKLKDAVDKSRKVMLDKFITALSIPNIAGATATVMAESCGWDIDIFIDRLNNRYDWSQLDGIGCKTSLDIKQWYWEPNHKFEIASLLDHLEFIKPEKKEVTDRSVQEKDTVNIDYTGYIDNEEFEGGKASAQDLKIGSDQYIDGFEDGLIGHNIGETVTLNLTFPKEYPNNKDLEGKAVVFEVKINSITESVLPELTDELVKEDGTYETVEELKTETRKTAIEEAVWNKVFSNCKIVKYPEKEVGKYYKNLLTNYKTMALQYGISFDTLATYYGFANGEELCMDISAYATSQTAQEMVLWSIVRAESLTLSADEYKAYAEDYAKVLDIASIDELEATYSKSYLEQSAYMEKVLEFLVGNAIAEK